MGVTLHFQTTGTVPGNGTPVPMIGPSLTLGRGPENDVCLPDPDKVVSKYHCTLEQRGGEVLITDLSTNGTFLNYVKTPLGRVPTPLNDGDILTIGPYELLVEIVGAANKSDNLLDPLDDPAPKPIPADAGLDDLLGGDPAGASGDDDFLKGLLGEAPLTGHKAVNRPELGEDGLLPPLDVDDLAPLEDDPRPDSGNSASDHSDAVSDAFTPSKALIPDDWDEDLLGGDEKDPFAEPEPEPEQDVGPETQSKADEAGPEDRPDEQTKAPQPIARPDPTAPVAGGDNAAARAFLNAAGAGDLNIPDAQLVATMARMGAVMQEMIKGLREILMTRASIKSEFRIQQTMIGRGDNNPLKFSISSEQAIETMVRPTAKGYLPADDAARQALDDIKAHEVAVMAAMEAALKGILKQLSPEVLEAQITTGGGLSGLLQGKKARYWDVYETMYSKISDQAETDFHELFAREFAKAYQAQLDRLK